MTEPEKNAIRAALEAGLRAGWTRNQALAAGLVRPFTGGTSIVTQNQAPSKCSWGQVLN